MFFVYILKSEKDGGLYIGRTNNLERRIREHNSGKVPSTKARRPFEIATYFTTETELESVLLERKYKKGYKREEIKLKYGGVA